MKILYFVTFFSLSMLVPNSTAFSTIQHDPIDYTKKMKMNHPMKFQSLSSRLQMSGIESAAELTSALATLDQKYQLTQRTSKRPTGGKAGWTKLILTNSEPKQEESSPFSTDLQETQQQNIEEFVYLLEPDTSPSLLIFFVGGAGLGQYPHIAYSELLKRISKRLNAAIIAAPYPLSLDHFDLSKKVGEALRQAVVQCEEKGGYSPDLPKFYLGHSLGSKLLTIALAASGIRDVQGIGFMSYNNFGFSDTISMVKMFANELNDGGSKNNSSTNGGIPVGFNLDQLLEFAGQAAGMMGLEFSPSPEDTNKIIQMKYDRELQEKTRLFVFNEDNLDSSDDFLESCEGPRPSVSRLNGSHLAPAYIRLSMDDLEIPEEAREYVDMASGGFQNASFGDEESMNGVVNAVTGWILGQNDDSFGKTTTKDTKNQTSES
jgi:hypothetical protein